MRQWLLNFFGDLLKPIVKEAVDEAVADIKKEINQEVEGVVKKANGLIEDCKKIFRLIPGLW